MHRLPELNVEGAGQRRERDESCIAELCKDVLGIEHTEDDVRAVIRLGKSRDDSTSRPLLIKMKNPEKAYIMAGCQSERRQTNTF